MQKQHNVTMISGKSTFNKNIENEQPTSQTTQQTPTT